MKRIGILGGTFNPPHLGHLIMANEAYDQMNLDEIWFMPNNVPPHKEADTSVCTKNRIDMLDLVSKDITHYVVQTYEVDQTVVSYTADTMDYLVKQYPEVEFYFIMGGDTIDYLPKFKNIDKLVSLVQFIGFVREGYESTSPYPIHLLKMPTIAISSSLIRERVANKKTIKYLVTSEVEAYIKENQLYES